MQKINKVLVANRGEISLRIMKSLKEMDIKTVAIYSEADRNALHVRYADEAVLVGPPPSAQSYLLMDRIIEEAKKLNVDAIHPGYGFLSENSVFAQKVADAGIVFIGPSPESIKTMGNKLAAKEAAQKFDIPMVPGGESAITDLKDAKAIASKTGYPILIKAAAGGGGKGMRIVESEEELEDQMHRAVSEAKSSFGDGAVFIEKYITSPRHIEIQVLGDMHGNIVHLFERECSVQRRYQKVIEEAPSSVLTPEIRNAMGKAAIDVARACNYYGAGTVEFILDENKDFYFLEMNTRLQVEHPVTEMITGKDLVKEQIKIAQGEKLSFSQEDLEINGHAIELRIYAEDPSNDFLPDTGTLEVYKKPFGPGVRVDDGYEQGMDIPIYYDPMISKLVAFSEDRKSAIERMLRAIDEYEISGVQTTLEFGKFVLLHKDFVSGNFDTHFVKKHYSDLPVPELNEDEQEIVALFTAYLEKSSNILQADTHLQTVEQNNNWKKKRRF